MLKRSMAAIQNWLSPEKSDRDSLLAQDGEACNARRGFFKKAAVGAVSITGTAGLAKVVVDSASQPNQQGQYNQYKRDGLAGERELTSREYVLMSDQEKADMVQALVDNYSDKT